MAAAIRLRADYSGDDLRRLARASRDANQTRRLLALASIHDGGSRSHAARLGGVGLQIVRDWVVRFNAEGPDGLLDRKAPGAAPKLTPAQMQALVDILESGPTPAIHGVVRWRLVDLAAWVHEKFGVSLSEAAMSRLVRWLGYARLSARPRHHARNELAADAFKKLPRPPGGDPGRSACRNRDRALVAGVNATVAPVGPRKRVNARIGQKNNITRRWARRGTRPSAPHDQRTRWAYIFGAICPRKGKGAGLVMPWADTHAMILHLAEISAAVDADAHAVVILDQAGWHMSTKLDIPANITLLPLPPRSPELNPVENVWQFMRDNWLSNRIFSSYDDIVAHCCESWNKLTDQPWHIMSIGLRHWAHEC